MEFKSLRKFIDASLVDMIVIDSAAAMAPQEELEGEVDKMGRIGLQANLMAKFLTRTKHKLDHGRKCALVIVNQTRANINIQNPRYGGGEVAAGGSAMKFYPSIRLELSIVKKENEHTLKEDSLYSRNRVRVTCVKNKVASPYRRGVHVLSLIHI